MKKTFISLISLVALLSSCGGNNNSQTKEDLSINDLELFVYDQENKIIVNNQIEGEIFSYAYEGDNLRIENDRVIALKANTETEVKVISSLNRTASFKVAIPNREYVSKHLEAEKNEGWFDEINVSKVDKMTSSFANGMDISSAKQLYDNGQQFYNRDGVEQSLFYILKDAGVNYISLRLWVDPKDTWIENGETKTYLYGGGNCDLEHVTWMAHEAKAAGLKVLLNLHYSDFWADPSHQIVPKAWINIKNVSAMANKINSYTKETLTYLKDNAALPDMIAIGNETYGGMMLQKPGGITKEGRNNEAPYYIEECSTNTLGTRAPFAKDGGKEGNANLRAYVKAGVDAVKEVDNNVLTMIHFVKGLSDPTTSIKFFRTFDDMDIDVYSLSGYIYYHFSNIDTLRNGLVSIANEFPNKKIAIAETSYGFTFESDVWANNSFNPTGECSPVIEYETSIHGQAKLVRDVSEVVANLDNGFGVFYWEGAWTPTKKSGWADYTSKASWSNQAFFSYNGKALGSLDVYRQMLAK